VGKGPNARSAVFFKRCARRTQRWSQQRRGVAVLAGLDENGLPEDARESILLGLSTYKEGRYEAALAEFERALTLPGTGVKQFTNKPALISDEERATALYNISCCQSKLENEYLALMALAGAMESGFRDFGAIFTDPELELIRKAPKLPGLIGMYNKDMGEKMDRVQKGVEEPVERAGMDAFLKGDWLWKKLTKSKPLTQAEWMKMTGDGSGSTLQNKED